MCRFICNKSAEMCFIYWKGQGGSIKLRGGGGRHDMLEYFHKCFGRKGLLLHYALTGKKLGRRQWRSSPAVWPHHWAASALGQAPLLSFIQKRKKTVMKLEWFEAAFLKQSCICMMCLSKSTWLHCHSFTNKHKGQGNKRASEQKKTKPGIK